MATVRAENLYKIFGPKPHAAVNMLKQGASRDDLRAEGTTAAVVDVSFEAKEGETFVVMGLSGSGKSTLIRTLNGINPPTSGQVLVNGTDVTKLSDKELRRMRSSTMSMVFQHFALFPHRTVLENAAYGLEVRGDKKTERSEAAERALAQVGLEGWGSSYPSQLSGGMQQRVGLARALATDTDVMLMDEAFSALDPLIRREMQDQLIELQRQLHKTIVFITHDLNEAMKLGDRIAMLRAGQIEQIGTAEEILNAPASEYVASFVQDVDRTRVLTASYVMSAATVTVRASDPISEAQQTLAESGLNGLHVLDHNGQLVGGITAAQLAAAAAGSSCGDVAVADVPTTTPNTTVVNLFQPVGENAVPVAVVDDNRTLLGVVTQTSLLASVGGTAADKMPADTPELIGQES